MPINERELSERDLLIQLKTQLADFKDYAREKFDSLDQKVGSITSIKEDLAALKQKVEENTRMRIWIYGSIITGLTSIALTLIFKYA